MFSWGDYNTVLGGVDGVVEVLSGCAFYGPVYDGGLSVVLVVVFECYCEAGVDPV